MQTTRRLVALGFAALVVAGCSNDEASAPSTASVSVTTTSVADTTVATAPPPASLTSSTTIASTTLPATTTTVPTEDLITQAVQDYFEAYQRCGIAPVLCQPEEFTASQGSSRAILSDFVAGLVGEGLYFSTDRRGQYLVAESVSLASSSEASATFCLYDAGIVMGPVGPDGQATVVNDVITSERYAYTVFLEEGLWIVGRERSIERLGEGNLCPPAE